MSDIEKSFTFLHDGIPSWFKDMAGIEENLLRLQEEIAKTPGPKTSPLKKRTGSVESIRDLDCITVGLDSSVAVTQPQIQATRKRKTPSVSSGHASGPRIPRSRAMIIVIYDGEIQKSFEKLVRAIGTGRNLLRKGKMAAKLQEFAALAGSEDDSESDDGDSAVMAKIGYRPRNGLSSMRSRGMMRGTFGNNTNSVTSSELFDSTDKALEQAQGLCEKAAHQSLRDGDCRKELEGMKKHFTEVLAIATKEHAKYVAKKEEEISKEEPKASSPPSVPAIESVETTPKPMEPIIRPVPVIHPTPSVAVDIEVDDDDDDDMDFVMPPIRLTSRA